jgi:hypothetical protein
MAASLDIVWAHDGALTIRGTRFVPHEQLALTLMVRTGGASSVTGPGTHTFSSSSAVQSTSGAARADAQGTWQWQGALLVSGDAEFRVAVRGDQGSRADARVVRAAADRSA